MPFTFRAHPTDTQQKSGGNMKLHAKRLAAAIGAAAAAVLLVSSPAVAGTDIYVNTTDPFNGGAAGFYSDGEIFTVCDNRSDGMRAIGHIFWQDSNGSHWVPVEDTNGSGNSCARKNLSIGEGEKVSVEICLQNGSSGDKKYCAIDRGGKA
ncbi:hypothetical protein [Streptomyces sp. NPDC047108]|uniref:hypothetical protein n=1 Tax=Streptomyces sp. NPDC047108 TaxID=3155025 RepID=UPI0033F9E0DE